MLVDFRGFDTFGEGVVLGARGPHGLRTPAALPSSGGGHGAPPAAAGPARDLQTDLVNPRQAMDTAVGYLTVPAVLVRLLLPVSGWWQSFFFLRGHNAPGGGFVAGWSCRSGSCFSTWSRARSGWRSACVSPREP